MVKTQLFSNFFVVLSFRSLLSCPMVCHQVQSYKTNKTSMGNAKNDAVAIYIDDIIAIDQSFYECLLALVETIYLFQKVGFVIHPDNNKFIPAKIVHEKF